MRMNFLWAALLTGLVAFALNCAPKPTSKEMEGKIKGKASLRLADGSTISQDSSDEYNPYLLHLSDGYLVLVFGSDRNGGLHNIFMAKSVEPYNGFELPAFEPPAVVTATASPIDEANMLNFAAAAQGTSVVLYVNLSSFSGAIRKGVATDPTAPDVGNFVAITNTNQDANTVIGINADGADLITTDAGGIAYLVNPDNNTTSSAFGANLDYSNSATQVRFDNSGQNDAYMGTYFGSTFAATATDYFGSIFDFDFSLADSGLSIGQMSTFYDSNGAFGDMVLFAAHDGISADIYVVTSHTAGMLWSMVAFFGFDTELPPAPTPEHWYTFDSGCGTDSSVTPGGWAASCTAITPTATSFDGSNYAPFNGSSSRLNIGAIDTTGDFTISVWIYIPSAATGNLMIASNTNAAADSDGFKFYAVASPDYKLVFETGDGAGPSSGYTVNSINGAWLPDTWHLVTVTASSTYGIADIYVDGGYVTMTLPPFIDTSYTTTGAGSLFFGANYDSLNFFNGSMDEIKIYSYYLSPMEVLALYLE